jgi:general secretion pathway protein G
LLKIAPDTAGLGARGSNLTAFGGPVYPPMCDIRSERDSTMFPPADVNPLAATVAPPETCRPVWRRRGARTTCHSAGFTLLELLVVLVIIGLLAALVGPQLLERLETSKITTTETQIRMLKTALDTLRLDIGRYPTTEEGLALLSNPPADPELRVRWHGPYLDNDLPNDAWGHPYTYIYSGTGNPPFALYSEGDRSASGPVKGIGIHPPG